MWNINTLMRQMWRTMTADKTLAKFLLAERILWKGRNFIGFTRSLMTQRSVVESRTYIILLIIIVTAEPSSRQNVLVDVYAVSQCSAEWMQGNEGNADEKRKPCSWKNGKNSVNSSGYDSKVAVSCSRGLVPQFLKVWIRFFNTKSPEIIDNWASEHIIHKSVIAWYPCRIVHWD